MDFLTIEELATACGRSRRTIDRKIQAYLKSSPDKIEAMIRHSEGTGRILYHPQIIEIIGLSKSIIEEVKAEIMAEPVAAPKVIKPRQKAKRTPKPPKEPKLKRGRYKTEPAKLTPRVISVDQMPDDELNQLADFRLVIDDWRTGMHTLPQCIAMHGLEQKVFFHWVNTRPIFNQEYTEAYEQHKANFNIYIREIAKESLIKVVGGYNITAESVTYKEMISPTGDAIRVPIERRINTRHVIPNMNGIVFALTNRDSEQWKRFYNPDDEDNRRKQPDPLEQMTDQELMNLVEEAKREGLLTLGDINGQNQQIV